MATPQSRLRRASFSLRLGHGAALICHRHIIHYRAATSLPYTGETNWGRGERVRDCILPRTEFSLNEFLAVYFLFIGATQQIIHTDIVKIGDGTKHLRRQHSPAAFVIGIGALRHIDRPAHLLLGQVGIFPQVAYSLIFCHGYCPTIIMKKIKLFYFWLIILFHCATVNIKSHKKPPPITQGRLFGILVWLF